MPGDTLYSLAVTENNAIVHYGFLLDKSYYANIADLLGLVEVDPAAPATIPHKRGNIRQMAEDGTLKRLRVRGRSGSGTTAIYKYFNIDCSADKAVSALGSLLGKIVKSYHNGALADFTIVKAGYKAKRYLK